MASNTEKRTVEIIMNGKSAGQTMKTLQGDVRQLNNYIRNLKPGTQEFIAASKKLQEVTAQYRSLKAEISGVGKAQSSFMSSLKTGVASVFGGNLLMQGFNKVRQFISEGISYSRQLEKSAANLSSLTGLTGANLEYLKRQAKELSQSTVEGNIRITKSAEDIQNAYTVVGSQRPELLKSKEALAEVTKQSLILAEAAQVDLNSAVRGVTTTLNQFDMAGSESGRIINVLAAGSKEGAGDVAYLAEALEKSGTAMKFANLNLEQGVGLIETLAPKFASPEMAGTQLKNTLLKLEAALDKNLRPSVVGLIPALENLRAKNWDTAKMVQFFGTENINTATILRDSIPDIQKYTTAVTGTSVALEQAAINTDTQAAKSEQARNKIMNAAAAWGKILSPAITAAQTALGHYLEKTAELIEGETPLTNSIRSTKAEFNAEMKVLMDANLPMDQRSKLIAEINKKYGEYLPFLIDEKTSYYELGHALESANNSLDKRIMLMMKEELIGRKTKEIADTYEVELMALKQIEKFKQDGHKEDYIGIKNMQFSLKNAADERNKLLNDIADVSRLVDGEMENLIRQKKKIDGIGSTLNPGPVPGEGDLNDEIAAAQAKLEKLNKMTETKHTELTSKEKKELEKRRKQQEHYLEQLEKMRAQHFIRMMDFDDRGLTAPDQQAGANVLKMLNLDGVKEAQENLEKAAKEVQDAIAKNALEEAAARASILQKTVEDEEAALQQRLDALEQLKQAELAALVLTDDVRAELAKKGITEQEYFAQQRLAIEQDYAEKAQDIQKQSLLKALDAFNEYYSQAQNIYGSINTIIQNGEDAKLQQFASDREKELQKLEEQREKKLVGDKAYEDKKKAIEDKYREQERAVKKQQFERQKAADAIQAGINTAVQVTKVLANPLLAGLVGLAGAAQVAAILSKETPEFYRGGFTDAVNRMPVPGFAKGGATNISSGGKVQGKQLAWVAEKGPEWVAPNWMFQRPDTLNIINMLEGIRVRGYAQGGFTSTVTEPVPTPVATNTTAPAGTEKLEALLILNMQAINGLNNTLKGGIAAVFGDTTVRDITDRQADFSNSDEQAFI